MWEIPHSSRPRRVVRRGGKTIADLIDDNDEILVGIERAALTDINLLNDLVGAGVPRRDKDGVIVGGIERAEGSVGECATADGAAFFQIEITDVVQLVRAVLVLRVVALRFDGQFRSSS